MDGLENSKVPLVWIFSTIGVMVTGFLVIVGIVIWGVRLEAKGDSGEMRLTKMELEQKQYREDQQEIQRQLVEIKVILNMKGK